MSGIVRRRAFTLVELLAVIAIIGLLAALLLPAIQSARESARRQTCSNNIRQIGQGLQLYHRSMGALPACGSVRPYNVNVNGSYSWMVYLLPYLDRLPFFEALNVMPPSVPYPLQDARRPQNPVYVCPSCPIQVDQHEQMYREYVWSSSSWYPNKSNYLGNAGLLFLHSPFATEPSFAQYSRMMRGAFRSTTDPPNPFNGYFFTTGVSFDAITDGLTMTFMVGEVGGPANAGFSPTLSNPAAVIPGLAIAGPYSDPPRQYFIRTSGNKINFGDNQSFGSSHVGGAYFVMCDGSVRFIGDEIEHVDFNVPAIQGVGGGWYGLNWGNHGQVLQEQRNPNRTGVYQRLSIRDDGNIIDEKKL